MNIISWNLNHRTLEKRIPDETIEFFRLKNADIIILNEYVDGPSRALFKESLRNLGYIYQQISHRLGNSNQLYIASKHEIHVGDLVAPQMDDSSKCNFLHVTFPTQNVEIVGFRAPCYTKATTKKLYWSLFHSIMNSASDRSICFIGDVNNDPFYKQPEGTAEVMLKEATAYRVPNPEGEWSYKSINGKHTSRIDHAYLSPSVSSNNPEYITTYKGITLAGSKTDNPVTDHAAYSIEIWNTHSPK